MVDGWGVHLDGPQRQGSRLWLVGWGRQRRGDNYSPLGSDGNSRYFPVRLETCLAFFPQKSKTTSTVSTAIRNPVEPAASRVVAVREALAG